MMNSANHFRDRPQTNFRYFEVNTLQSAWGLFVTTFGRSVIHPGEAYPPVRHPHDYKLSWRHGRQLKDHQIVLIEDGGGVFESERIKTRVRPGDVILLRAGVWHRYRPDEATGWREHWVGFGGFYADHIVELLSLRNPSAIHTDLTPRAMRRYFKAIQQCIDRNSSAVQQELSAQVLNMLAMLYPDAPAQRKGNAGAEESLRRVLDAFRSELQARDPTAELFSHLHLNYNTMRQAFRRQIGISPHQYRLALRLSLVKELLRNTDKSLREIAAEAGFPSEQYLCRVFKRHEALTPGQYRESGAAVSAANIAHNDEEDR